METREKERIEKKRDVSRNKPNKTCFRPTTLNFNSRF